MEFELKNKVALISGGASGIGLAYAKELLKSGLKGVTLADLNEDHGKKALHDIEIMFGCDKAIFVLTDVAKRESFENAFKKTIDTFQNLDILINNAGIFNDSCWEKEVAVNLNGTIHGILLALDNYIPKYKTGSEGIIVNISSVAGLESEPSMPIYSATKSAVVAMSTFGYEEHYKRTEVKVLTLCPGPTATPMLLENPENTLGPGYQKIMDIRAQNMALQKPESVALALVQIIKNAKSGTVWVANGDQEPYEHVRSS